jgi:hypothetical protein
MITFLAIGTIWFYVLTFAYVGIMMGILEDEELTSIASSIATTIFLALLFFFGCRTELTDIAMWIGNHPLESIGVILLYFIAGIVWSLIKWKFYLVDLVAKQSEGSTVYESDFNLYRNKSRIINWMSYWPFSLTWNLVNRPIKSAYKRIFVLVSRTYERMSESAINDAKSKSKSKA